MKAKLEATSDLLADEMPISDLDIKLEGKSEARVWVLDHLSGKGEGQSKVYLQGNPHVK